MSTQPATATPMEHAVLLRCDHGGRELLTPAEAEQLSAELLRAATSARAYRDEDRPGRAKRSMIARKAVEARKTRPVKRSKTP